MSQRIHFDCTNTLLVPSINKYFGEDVCDKLLYRIYPQKRIPTGYMWERIYSINKIPYHTCGPEGKMNSTNIKSHANGARKWYTKIVTPDELKIDRLLINFFMFNLICCKNGTAFESYSMYDCVVCNAVLWLYKGCIYSDKMWRAHSIWGVWRPGAVPPKSNKAQLPKLMFSIQYKSEVRYTDVSSKF